MALCFGAPGACLVVASTIVFAVGGSHEVADWDLWFVGIYRTTPNNLCLVKDVRGEVIIRTSSRHSGLVVRGFTASRNRAQD